MALENNKLLDSIAKKLKQKNECLVTAESCTGGGLAYQITSIPGSSQWFDQGFVVYNNTAKETQLGVSNELLNQYGAVSEEVAHAMATGALAKSGADIAVSVTGIAGPDGGSKEKPVGLVWFGLGRETRIQTMQHRFLGSRNEIRAQAIMFILEKLNQYLDT